MFGKLFGSKKTKPATLDPEELNAELEAAADGLAADAPSDPILTDEEIAENARQMIEQQARVHDMREATSALLREEHPEVIRRDTVEQEHEDTTNTDETSPPQEEKM